LCDVGNPERFYIDDDDDDDNTEKHAHSFEQKLTQVGLFEVVILKLSH
jgi:hypothetical protein